MLSDDPNINKFVKDFLQPGEAIQEGFLPLFEKFAYKIVEAGVLSAGSMDYRYGSGVVTGKSLNKRVINNLSLLTKSWKPFSIGLVDVSDETLTSRHKILQSQFNLVLRNYLPDDAERGNVSADLADVILASWSLVHRL